MKRSRLIYVTTVFRIATERRGLNLSVRDWYGLVTCLCSITHTRMLDRLEAAEKLPGLFGCLWRAAKDKLSETEIILKPYLLETSPFTRCVLYTVSGVRRLKFYKYSIIVVTIILKIEPLSLYNGKREIHIYAAKKKNTTLYQRSLMSHVGIQGTRKVYPYKKKHQTLSYGVGRPEAKHGFGRQQIKTRIHSRARIAFGMR